MYLIQSKFYFLDLLNLLTCGLYDVTSLLRITGNFHILSRRVDGAAADRALLFAHTHQRVVLLQTAVSGQHLDHGRACLPASYSPKHAFPLSIDMEAI